MLRIGHDSFVPHSIQFTFHWLSYLSTVGNLSNWAHRQISCEQARIYMNCCKRHVTKIVNCKNVTRNQPPSQNFQKSNMFRCNKNFISSSYCASLQNNRYWKSSVLISQGLLKCVLLFKNKVGQLQPKVRSHNFSKDSPEVSTCVYIYQKGMDWSKYKTVIYKQ
jgi:hypothetical protein